MTKTTDTKPKSAAAPKATKQQLLIDLLLNDQGATIAQMMEATGWQAHTARAMLTGLKKKGYVVTSDKADGPRVYRATVPATSA